VLANRCAPVHRVLSTVTERLVDADRLAREVLALIGDTPGNRPHIRLLATAALATAFESQGRYSEAVKTYGRLVELDSSRHVRDWQLPARRHPTDRATGWLPDSPSVLPVSCATIPFGARRRRFGILLRPDACTRGRGRIDLTTRRVTAVPIIALRHLSREEIATDL